MADEVTIPIKPAYGEQFILKYGKLIMPAVVTGVSWSDYKGAMNITLTIQNVGPITVTSAYDVV